MSRSNPLRSYDGLHVLIAGGGVAAFEAAFALRALAGDLVDIELLAPEPRFFYQPQAVLEPFAGERVQEFEAADLARSAAAQLTIGALASVSPDEHRARTAQGMTIEYDVLLIACGASPRPFVRDALTFRGPADAERVGAIARAARLGNVGRITLAIPTPCTWPLPIYELAFGLRSVTDVPIAVSTVEPVAGAVLGRLGSEALASRLAGHGIDVVAAADVRSDAAGIDVAAPELRGDRILGIPADDDGFIPASRLGAVHGLHDVFAAGDITSYDHKHGSLAAAQADAAAEAIAAAAGVELVPAPFQPILYAWVACGETSIYVRRDLDDARDEGTVSQDPLWSPGGKIFARHLGPVLAELSRRHRRSRLSSA